MIDALLFAVRDAIRAAGFNYGQAECTLTEDGHPPARMGNAFVAVHGGDVQSVADNQLDERFTFLVTLTMRVTIPPDKLGESLMSRNLALVPLAQRQGFYAKREQLRSILHMNWGITVLTGQTPNSANDNIIAWMNGTVYGFCEPARYRSGEVPKLVGAEWLAGDPEQDDWYAVKSEMRFEGARRFQPITDQIGPFDGQATVISMSPSSCYLGGNQVSVFSGLWTTVNSVTFGSVPAQFFFVNANGQLRASPFPVTAPQTVTVTITTPTGTYTCPFTFKKATIAGNVTLFTPFTVNGTNQAWHVCNGNDGRIWWANDPENDTVFAMNTDGTGVQSFQITTTTGHLYFGIAGSGGNLWFTDNGGRFWKVPPMSLPSGTGIVSYALSGQTELVTIAQNGVFFVLSTSLNFFSITDAGVVTTFTAPTTTPASQIGGICTGPDGNLYIAFTNTGGAGTYHGVYQYSSAGVLLNTYLITPSTSGSVEGLTIGPDGNLWALFFSFESFTSVLVLSFANPSVILQTIPIVSSPGNYQTQQYPLVPGPDGNMYMTVSVNRSGMAGLYDNYLVQMTTANPSVVTMILITNPPSQGTLAGTTTAPCQGPDGAIWMGCGTQGILKVT